MHDWRQGDNLMMQVDAWLKWGGGNVMMQLDAWQGDGGKVMLQVDAWLEGRRQVDDAGGCMAKGWGAS